MNKICLLSEIGQQEIMNNISTTNLHHNEKIAEMLGKIELNVSGLVSLRRETTELLNTTRTAIEADARTKNDYHQR